MTVVSMKNEDKKKILPKFKEIFELATDSVEPFLGIGAQGNGAQYFLEADYGVAAAIIDDGMAATPGNLRSLLVARSMLQYIAENIHPSAVKDDILERSRAAVSVLDTVIEKTITVGRAR